MNTKIQIIVDAKEINSGTAIPKRWSTNQTIKKENQVEYITKAVKIVK